MVTIEGSTRVEKGMKGPIQDLLKKCNSAPSYMMLVIWLLQDLAVKNCVDQS
jgi:hypothetical protein